MTEYNPGDVIRIINKFTDIDGDLYDPTTIELRIYNPIPVLSKSVTYAASEIIRDSEGVYHYDYLIPDDAKSGYWVTQWEGEAGGFIDISENQFRIIPLAEKLYCSVAEVKNCLMSEGFTMTDDIIRTLIRYSMAEVDTITGRSFYNGTEFTEWFNTTTANPNTFLNQLFLLKQPVQDIVSLEEFDTSGTLLKTWTATEYFLDNGIVTLLEGAFSHGIHRVKCVYEYGYVAVPRNVSMLTSIIAQIKVMRQYLIMQDSEMTGFSIPEIGDVQVGEVYMTAQIAIRDLKDEYKRLISVIGDLRNNIFIL